MKGCSNCARMTRRQLLGGAGSWAALASMAKLGENDVRAQAVNVRGSATACVFVNMNGAPSHLDTFDVKDAPWNPPDARLREHPGGMLLSEALFPELSKISSDLLLLRSVTSWEAAHDRGQFYLQTSHPSNPAFSAETPHIGAVVALEKAYGPLPPFLALNGGAGQGAKFLPGRFEPMATPSNAGGLTTIQHNFFGAQSQSRFLDRYKMLEDLDASLRAAPYDKLMADHAAYYGVARQLMYDEAIASVFRFSTEDSARYGDNNFGRSCLVARNAVQARNGTVFITIAHPGWDTHQNMFDRQAPGNMYTLCNTLDRGVGALVEDLKASGDFERTVIVMMGEFGRTPGPLNTRGGRDHHRSAMSVAMLGGGVRGGRVIGATDRNGDKVADPGWHKQRAIFMEDITATLYSALGINWTKTITDTPSGRRFEYVPSALNGTYTAIHEVFG